MKAIIKEFLVAMAYLRLRAKARKKRSESAPDSKRGGQERFWPIFYIDNTQFLFSGTGGVTANAGTLTGSCLDFPTSALGT